MKNILLIFLTAFSLSAFGQASTVTFENKDKNAVDGIKNKVRDVDLNELKAVINANATILNGKQATLSSGSNIKTVQGTTVLGSGDVDLIDDAIVNGELKAPSQNAVFDALALRALLSSFVENEVPSGTVNSSNVTFTIANTPVTGSVKLYMDGQRLKGGGVDYSISGATITFVTAPETGSQLLTDYRK